MEEYRTITTTIKVASCTEKALAVDPHPSRRMGSTHVVWIPRSLVHGWDLLGIERREKKTTGEFEATFRVMAWKAEEQGWA